MAFSITTKEAAKYLGVSIGRVHQLIESGQLEAEKVGSQWLISRHSLEARIASHPTAGRPRTNQEYDNASLLRFTLMNGPYEVLKFTCTQGDYKFLAVQEIIDANRAPLGVVSARGAKASTIALNRWWKHRSIPDNRENIDAKLLELGLDKSYKLPFFSFGLSLSDQYWVCPEEEGLSWEQINFFKNGFAGSSTKPSNASHDWLANVGLKSPDNTSEGYLPKRWIRKNGKSCLVKGGEGLNQEPYNEAIASALHRRLLEPHEFVKYSLTRGEFATCLCENFISEEEELIPAFYIKDIKRKPNHFSEFQHYVDCCASLGVADAELQLSKMLVCDFILANHDRHWRNFGLVRNINSLAFKAAPIFDSGSCLWCNRPVEALRKGDFSFACKPFHEDPKRQLRVVQDLSWLDIKRLEGFAEEAAEILAASEALKDRAPFIAAGINSQIEQLKVLQSF